MKRSFTRRSWLLAAAIVAVLGAAVAGSSAAGVTFSNPAPITIPTSGAASPYPSDITVSGMPGTISDVNATLTGFNHPFVDEVDVLLVGPGGQSAILMSDAAFVAPNGSAASNLTLTFDDEAAASLPQTAALASGSYRPANWPEPTTVCGQPLGNTIDTFPAAPAGPYGSTLAAFDGTSANGTWSLYVVDDCVGDGGSFSGGWSLDITTPGQSIGDLRDLVASMDIHHGIANALDSKLRAALAALEVDDTAGACGSLQAFLNQVAAQNGKKLTEEQAEQLTDAANDIRDQLGC